ncbi:hypothetical protein [Magnetospirillum fulvum]|uniref:PRY3 protein n=1 Tax=Magnetospirillum fulvum MGU-K5 TaxID=1316936 RepID=S9TS39_MAGFU|nr:hypothetical protein [Magnetospirillum fulvum]EPY01370.1 PRY3 protein [Magnetospirillum fulvum MGU-K5]
MRAVQPFGTAPGTPYHNGDPMGGSGVDASFFNVINAEMLGVLTAAGMDPSLDDADLGQLAKAIAKMGARANGEVSHLIDRMGLPDDGGAYARLASAFAAGRFINIPGLPSLGAGGDSDEIAIASGGGHYRISLSQLFAGRIGSRLLDQIALANMRSMLNSAVTSGALVQGKQWELLSDEWGASSSNATYLNVQGGLSYYSNVANITTLSSSGKWAGSSAITYSGSNITSNDTNANLHSINSFDGDFSVSFSLAGCSNYGPVWDIYFGVYPSSLVSNFSAAGDAGGMMAMPSAWWIGGDVVTSPKVSYGSTVGITTLSGSATTVWTIGRSGATLTLRKDGVIAYTWSQTSAAPLQLCVGGSTSAQITGIAWTVPGGGADMILMPPSPVALSSSPAYADMYALYRDDSGASTLGTDLTAEISRDGGASFAPATIAALAAYDGTYTLIRARANLSGQPVGVSLTGRIAARNGKVQRVAAPALYAE